MATLIGRVKKLDDVTDENARQYYKKEVINGKDTGHFILDIPERDGYAFENIMSLKSATASERENVAKLTNTLNAFKDSKGNLMDAVRVQSELEELVKLRESGPKSSEAEKAKWATKETELTTAWKNKFSDQQKRITELDSENRTLHVTHKARTALSKHNVLPEWEDMMLGHMEKVMQVKEGTDGKRVTRIIGEGGIELPSMQPGSTAPMKESEYVKRNLVAKYPGAFSAPDAQGSGAPGGNKGDSEGTLGTHEISREDARNPETYQTAKDAAEKAGAKLAIVGD